MSRHAVRAHASHAARPRVGGRGRRPAAPIACWRSTADVSTADGVEAVVERTVDDVWRHRRAGQQRRAGARRRTCSRRPTPSGRRRSTRRCSRRCAPRAWPCRTCSGAAAASIVIIASIFGREAGGRMTYNAVKAAEISLAKSLAQQLAPSNIRVNSVSPGSILFEGGSWWKRQQADPGGDRRVRQARAAVRPLRPARGGRRRRRLPRLAARQLDQRHVGRRRRLSEPGVLEWGSRAPGFGFRLPAPGLRRLVPDARGRTTDSWR